MADYSRVAILFGKFDGVQVSVREPIWFTLTRSELATPAPDFFAKELNRTNGPDFEEFE